MNGFKPTLAALLLLACTGCSATRPQVSSDLQTALQAAASLESVYAGLPSADPKVVAKLTLLLTVAESAVTTFAASASPTDQAAAESAIAAVAAYASSVSEKPN